MENVPIRKATIDDAKAICQLNCDEMGYCYSLDKTENRLRLLLDNPGHCILVAVLDTQVVGYIHANSHELIFSDPLKNIMGIAVDSSHKRKGIGKKLLAAVEAWAADSGAAGVRLTSGSARTGAHQFYQSCGYTKNKEQINFSKLFPPRLF